MTVKRPTAETEPVLLRADRESVATLTLNRPQARNALSQALMERLIAELDAIAADPSVRVVVIAGAGPAFCAGHDLREIRALGGEDDYKTLFATCARLMLTITHLSKPVIARVHGAAFAAGCQLVASCDLAVASDSATFATPGVNIGLFCSTPMVAVSRKIGRKPMMEMLLLGEPVGAAEAQRLGLVNRCVPDETLDSTVADFARKIAGKSALTLRIGKEAFYRQAEMGLEDAYAYCSEVMTRNMMAEDAEEGIDAFLEKAAAIVAGPITAQTGLPSMPEPLHYDDDFIRDILRQTLVIALVGASTNWNRPSYFVMKYLQRKNYRVIPVNPGAVGQEILGEPVVASLADIQEPVDMVDIFRNSEAAGAIADEAIAIGAKFVWMQIGVRNDAAADRAAKAGLAVVMDRCPKIEYSRLCGELSWLGMNSGVISSKRRRI